MTTMVCAAPAILIAETAEIFARHQEIEYLHAVNSGTLVTGTTPDTRLIDPHDPKHEENQQMGTRHLNRQVKKAQKAAYKAALAVYLAAIRNGTAAVLPAKTWLQPSPTRGTRS
jgi:hypothetical protein